MLIVCISLCSSQEEATAGTAEWQKHTRDGAAAFSDLRYGDAERGFKAAIEEAKKLGSGDARLASSLTNLGVLYDSRGDWEKAEPLFAQAVVIKEKVLGPYTLETADSAARLCQFYIRKNRFDKADPLCQKVIVFGDREISDLNKMNSAFATLTAYFKNHKEMGREEELILRAKTQAKSKADTYYLELAVLLDRVASSYNDHPTHGRYTQSERLYKQALSFREQVLSGNHLALAASYGNLGNLYAKERRYHLAEPLQHKAFEISQKTVGLSKPLTYDYLSSWGHTLTALGRHSHAERYYRNAVAELESSSGSDENCKAKAQLDLANLLEARGQYDEAASIMARAVKAREKMYGPKHAMMAPLLDRYAELLGKTKRRREASRQQARAEKIRS